MTRIIRFSDKIGQLFWSSASFKPQAASDRADLLQLAACSLQLVAKNCF